VWGLLLGVAVDMDADLSNDAAGGGRLKEFGLLGDRSAAEPSEVEREST